MNPELAQISQSIVKNFFSVPTRVESLLSLKNQSLLVTGGTGFVGSWICEFVSYLNSHHNFNTQLTLLCRNPEKVKSNRPSYFQNKYFNFVKGDVRSPLDLPTEVDYIIHAATNPDQHFYQTTPVETTSTISQGTTNILHFATRADRLKMFLHLSSGLVYGSSQSASLISESSTQGPALNDLSSVYAEAKRFSEAVCTSFRHEYRIPTTIVRPFSFLGPYQKLESPWAANTFILSALKGQTLKIFGDGESIRSYMFAPDMAFWILNILTRASSGSHYNLGSSEGVSLLHLAQTLVKSIDPTLNIQVSRNENVKRSFSVPSTQSAEKDFGLKTITNLETTLSETIRWYKELIKTI